jgi:hypothetical protein
LARSWHDPEDLRRSLAGAERRLAKARARIEELERRRWKDRMVRLLTRRR